jgi:glucose-1-phosphate thymidylyltransferase|tara:strand:- start:666 stop:857 length:192 start_codon:yes stop_codon:yes gene_type:complete
MIYYALTTLLSASINEICIICSADDISGYKKLLGDGREFGSSLTYIIQEKMNMSVSIHNFLGF